MSKSYTKVIKILLDSKKHQAVIYISEKRTIKATRRLYKSKPMKGKTEIQLTDGPPNHRERLAIKRMKRAGTWTNRTVEVR